MCFFADVDYRPEPITLGGFFRKLLGKKTPSQDEQLIARIEELTARDFRLGIRVYRTKAGFRCLVVSRTFDPLSNEATSLLDELGSDRRYIKLCQVQECFRARVSPKPWRCGVGDPPCRFPFPDEEAQRRYREWEKQYAETAKSYSTCSHIGDFGSNSIHPRFEAVIKLHDDLACAGNGPLC